MLSSWRRLSRSIKGIRMEIKDLLKRIERAERILLLQEEMREAILKNLGYPELFDEYDKLIAELREEKGEK